MIIKHLLILILFLICCSETNHNQRSSSPKSQSAYNRQSSPPQKLSSIDKENLKKEIIEELRQEFKSEPKKKEASYYHAVRRYLMTRDIYQVMRELGHTKVTTTQIYADFEDTVDIEKEFPSIKKPSNVPIFSKEDTLLEDTSDIASLYVY